MAQLEDQLRDQLINHWRHWRRRLALLVSVGVFVIMQFGAHRNWAHATDCTSFLRLIDTNSEVVHLVNEWKTMGRLAHLAKILSPGDSAAIKLKFVGPRSTYIFARQQLHKHNAHFIRTKLAEFQPLRSFWEARQRDPIGRGQIELRVTRSELADLRPYIELADQIQLEDVIGVEDNEHVLKGQRSFEGRMNPAQNDLWQWLKKRPLQIVRIQTLTSYDKKTFQALVNRLMKLQDRVQVEKVHYDTLLSMGYLIISGKLSDMSHVLEGLPEIHMVHMLGAAGREI